MKYELEFVKISNQHEYAGVGFAGNIFITLNALTHISPNDKLVVNMEKQDCVCTERNSNLYGTENCWEYYFDQESIEQGEEIGKGASQWVINLRASVRPLITYGMFVMLLFVNIFGFFYAWKTGVPFDQAMAILWDEDSAIIFSSVIAFWFGTQSFKK